ncbi:DUF3120 domain-containing protein [Geitlerinema sp. PCC 9228]|uniref:DUF3120 domain-containing protein n=1 Tax=Geitlerinema sp. PCC 9228 TaxID=111611 RepID=UPI000A064943|nr:DUF3120 domain-containing protein [Geitlerinema sp. PCC 9228]
MLNTHISLLEKAVPKSTTSAKKIFPPQIALKWQAFFGAVFLVCVPVFIQAPMVRELPLASLAITGIWVWLGMRLLSQPKMALWGDLLLGFSWSWLAGSIYWGWLRAEPYVHLPVEAIGLPFAIWCLYRGRWQVGNWFYLGSLLGTAITDLYFYAVGLIPYWRRVMQVDPEQALPILQEAVALVQTPWGISCAGLLAAILLATGLFPLRIRQARWWAFSGAVLSTILVDFLFWLGASAA